MIKVESFTSIRNKKELEKLLNKIDGQRVLALYNTFIKYQAGENEVEYYENLNPLILTVREEIYQLSDDFIISELEFEKMISETEIIFSSRHFISNQKENTTQSSKQILFASEQSQLGSLVKESIYKGNQRLCVYYKNVPGTVTVGHLNEYSDEVTLFSYEQTGMAELEDAKLIIDQKLLNNRDVYLACRNNCVDMTIHSNNDFVKYPTLLKKLDFLGQSII